MNKNKRMVMDVDAAVWKRMWDRMQKNKIVKRRKVKRKVSKIGGFYPVNSLSSSADPRTPQRNSQKALPKSPKSPFSPTAARPRYLSPTRLISPLIALKKDIPNDDKSKVLSPNIDVKAVAPNQSGKKLHVHFEDHDDMPKRRNRLIKFYERSDDDSDADFRAFARSPLREITPVKKDGIRKYLKTPPT